MPRRLLGIPLEKHHKFAFALFEMDWLAQHPPYSSRMKDACNKLRSELDEHVFMEFTELPEQKRLDVYYTFPHGFPEQKFDLEHDIRVLSELIDELEAVDPGGKAIIHARKLQQETDMFSLRLESQARKQVRQRF